MGPAPPALAGGLCGHRALRAYIPEAVRKWLELGQMQWLGESRRVTVLFISLSGLEGLDVDEIAPDAITRVQTAFVAVQRVRCAHASHLLALVDRIACASNVADLRRSMPVRHT